jgi:hypothetical protein
LTELRNPPKRLAGPGIGIPTRATIPDVGGSEGIEGLGELLEEGPGRRPAGIGTVTKGDGGPLPM